MRTTAEKIGKTRWSYRGITLWYGRNSSRADKWSYDLSDVVSSSYYEKMRNRYEPFRYRARTRTEAMQHIDEMYEKGLLKGDS